MPYFFNSASMMPSRSCTFRPAVVNCAFRLAKFTFVCVSRLARSRCKAVCSLNMPSVLAISSADFRSDRRAVCSSVSSLALNSPMFWPIVS